MFKTFHIVRYKPNDNPETPRAASCIPLLDPVVAQASADLINHAEPWRDAVVESETVEFHEVTTRSTCNKCGTTKVSDLFKGEYCPRCNDWC